MDEDAEAAHGDSRESELEKCRRQQWSPAPSIAALIAQTLRLLLRYGRSAREGELCRSHIRDPHVPLSFAMHPQGEDNWCWLAVAASVADYYAGVVHRQCDLAQALVSKLPPGIVCCGRPTPTVCDAQGNPSVSLRHVGHASGSVHGLAPFNDLATEIANNRPVAISYVSKHSGVSHVVVVTDAFIRQKTEMLRFEDPDTASPTVVKYGDPPQTRLAISWVRSYFTKP